jgi:hypothetical protein
MEILVRHDMECVQKGESGLFAFTIKWTKNGKKIFQLQATPLSHPKCNKP